MKLVFVVIMIVSPLLGQGTPNSSTAPVSKELMKNSRLAAYAAEIPGKKTNLWKETHDSLSVVVTGTGKENVVIRRNPKGSAIAKPTQNLGPGSVTLEPAGVSVRMQNTCNDSLKLVRVQFSDRVGRVEPPKTSHSHYCNDDNPKLCVTEKYLFCTHNFCAEEVTMAPGARSTRHSHDTEHMLIAITDYSLADDVSGKGIVHREVKSGGVEYLPAGITHVLTNTGTSEAHLVAIIFR